MGDRIDYLFQEWYRLGRAVLLAQIDSSIPERPPEQVIAESTAYCRDSGRLTWAVLGWLVRHVDQIDAQALLEETSKTGDLSVLGVLCDAALQKNPHTTFTQIIRRCPIPDKIEPFFQRVVCSPLALALTRENALALFERWSCLHSELRYL